MVDDFSKRIASSTNGAAGARNASDDLDVLTRGEGAPGNHLVERSQCYALRKMTLQAFHGQRRPGVSVIANEYE